MNIFEDLFLLERIDHLIRTKSTGNAEELGKKIGKSERSASRYIEELQSLGLPIAYDKKRHTFYYTESVKLDFLLQVGAEKLLTIHGGEK